jgi:hypothetical protein
MEYEKNNFKSFGKSISCKAEIWVEDTGILTFEQLSIYETESTLTNITFYDTKTSQFYKITPIQLIDVIKRMPFENNRPVVNAPYLPKVIEVKANG